MNNITNSPNHTPSTEGLNYATNPDPDSFSLILRHLDDFSLQCCACTSKAWLILTQKEAPCIVNRKIGRIIKDLLDGTSSLKRTLTPFTIHESTVLALHKKITEAQCESLKKITSSTTPKNLISLKAQSQCTIDEIITIISNGIITSFTENHAKIYNAILLLTLQRPENLDSDLTELIFNLYGEIQTFTEILSVCTLLIDDEKVLSNILVTFCGVAIQKEPENFIKILDLIKCIAQESRRESRYQQIIETVCCGNDIIKYLPHLPHLIKIVQLLSPSRQEMNFKLLVNALVRADQLYLAIKVINSIPTRSLRPHIYVTPNLILKKCSYKNNPAYNL